VGVVLIRNLLSEFDKAEDIFKASKKKLTQIDGINVKTSETIKNLMNKKRSIKNLKK
jgi:ERCC4-type nuclease